MIHVCGWLSLACLAAASNPFNNNPCQSSMLDLNLEKGICFGQFENISKSWQPETSI